MAEKKKKEEKRNDRLIRLPMPIWDALDADAERCRRSATKQLEAIMVAYYNIENVNIPSDVINQVRTKASNIEIQRSVSDNHVELNNLYRNLPNEIQNVIRMFAENLYAIYTSKAHPEILKEYGQSYQSTPPNELMSNQVDDETKRKMEELRKQIDKMTPEELIEMAERGRQARIDEFESDDVDSNNKKAG